MKKLLVLLAIVAAVLAACGEREPSAGSDGGTDEPPACTSSPTPIPSPTTLPSTFPNPVSVTYTSTETLGPTQVIEGYTSTGFAQAYEAYKAILATGGYSVTKTEKEDVDAEVNYAGHGTSGQLKLEVDCRDYTKVRITVRPE